MPEDPLNDWLTKTEAAAFLRVSEKTIERLAAKGDVRRATRKRAGLRPLPVYDPRGLEKLKDSQTIEAVVVPQDHGNPTQALAPRPDLSSFLEALLPAKGVPLQDKLFLNVKEAALYSGLPQATIRRLIHSGDLPAAKAGGWRIQRSDLKQLSWRQLADMSDKTVFNTENK